MSATVIQIARLRRMVNEPISSTYSDEDIASYIERYPLLDSNGEEPYVLDATTTPPTLDGNDSWMPTYDLAAAAADIWAERAAVLSQNFDFAADGEQYSRSQSYEAAMKQSRYWASRRRPTGMLSHVSPGPGSGADWIGNLPESD